MKATTAKKRNFFFEGVKVSVVASILRKWNAIPLVEKHKFIDAAYEDIIKRFNTEGEKALEEAFKQDNDLYESLAAVRDINLFVPAPPDGSYSDVEYCVFEGDPAKLRIAADKMQRAAKNLRGRAESIESRPSPMAQGNEGLRLILVQHWAGALGATVRMGYIGSNPAAGVDYLPKRAEKIEKGTFAPEEVSLLVDAAPSDDWKGVIRIGYYAGLRLGDALSIRWGDIDLQHCLMTFIPRKTARLGKKLAIPLHPELERFFLSHPAGARDTDPVFPSLAKLRIGGRSGASMSFARIMAKAGLASGTAREKHGKKGRKVSIRSFHSLRHSVRVRAVRRRCYCGNTTETGRSRERGTELALHPTRKLPRFEQRLRSYLD